MGSPTCGQAAAATLVPEALPCTQALAQPFPPSLASQDHARSRSLSLGLQPGVQGAGPPVGPCHYPQLQWGTQRPQGLCPVLPVARRRSALP